MEKVFNFRCDEQTNTALDNLAKASGTSRSAVIRQLVAHAEADLYEQQTMRQHVRRELGVETPALQEAM